MTLLPLTILALVLAVLGLAWSVYATLKLVRRIEDLEDRA